MNMDDPRSMAHKVLAGLPGTCPDLAKRAGVERTTPIKWIKLAHARGEVYISGWTEGRNPSAIYARGNLPDVPYKKMTKSETGKRYRERLKKSGEYYFMQAKRRASWHADQHAKRPKRGIFAALGL